MTRTTTLATLLAAALGLSACMSNTAGTETDAGVSAEAGAETGVANDVYDADEGETMGDAVSTPTDGIEDGPDL